MTFCRENPKIASAGCIKVKVLMNLHQNHNKRTIMLKFEDKLDAKVEDES